MKKVYSITVTKQFSTTIKVEANTPLQAEEAVRTRDIYSDVIDYIKDYDFTEYEVTNYELTPNI